MGGDLPRGNNNNLIPGNELSHKEATENGRKGGIKSGEVRRRKKSIKELVKIALETPMPDKTKAELIKKNPALADEDINLRLAMVLGQADSAKKGNTSAFTKLIELEEENSDDQKEYKIPAEKIASSFCDVNRYITNRDYQEYVFKGGRGSTKSSYISMKIIELIKNNNTLHAVVVRKIGDTLRQSVYAQTVWAISELGLEDEFKCTVSPMEIVRKSTGQKIYFRGADDAAKLKSIKVTFGYIGILWFEELDSFQGDEQIRSITQSVVRGGETAYIFKSFNPPITQRNWANKYVLGAKENRFVHDSTYQTVPYRWLGKPFIEEAEWLKENNEKAYRHEYLGEPVGIGTTIFENLDIRQIPDAEIKTFSYFYYGLDFGWYPDPTAFIGMSYNKQQQTLYIFKEIYRNKTPLEDFSELIKEHRQDTVIADSAEPRSINTLRSLGNLIIGAEKGPGSVGFSMKWLQSLKQIVIDPVRCPRAANEWQSYEYEKDKDGNVISGYPDGDIHSIDGVRYALQYEWMRYPKRK